MCPGYCSPWEAHNGNTRFWVSFPHISNPRWKRQDMGRQASNYASLEDWQPPADVPPRWDRSRFLHRPRWDPRGEVEARLATTVKAIGGWRVYRPIRQHKCVHCESTSWENAFFCVGDAIVLSVVPTQFSIVAAPFLGTNKIARQLKPTVWGRRTLKYALSLPAIYARITQSNAPQSCNIDIVCSLALPFLPLCFP